MNKNNIDLPPPSLLITSDPEPLANTSVELLLKTGKRFNYFLISLSYAKKSLTVSDQDGKNRITFGFDDVLLIRFLNKINLDASNKHGFHRTKGVELPSSNQEYSITFYNGKILKGRMKSSCVDRGGFHIFNIEGNLDVIRYFIPLEAIENYCFGDKLGERLIKNKKVSKHDINLALIKHSKQKKQFDTSEDSGEVLNKTSPAGSIAIYKQANKKLGEQLMDMNAASDQEIHRSIAQQLGIAFVDLKEFSADMKALSIIPREIAEKYLVFPLEIRKDRLLVAFENPLDNEALDIVGFLSDRHIEIATATRKDIVSFINDKYDKVAITRHLLEAEKLQLEDQNYSCASDEDKSRDLSNTRPTVGLVDKIIRDAVDQKASDIHVRPGDVNVDLVYRINGEMVKQRTFHRALLPSFIARLKVIGRMNVSERRLPQDGRARIINGNEKTDLRISVIPTISGESAVIRLLSNSNSVLAIREIGFNKTDLEVLLGLLHRSYGLILVTGPTGSGKSTTLYAALSDLIKRNLNIITVEDPVEYHVQGIEQIQINTAQNYTFARALKHILRHDPDVIMIGEIRDEETADIAIQSSLTGHLVLSTLHTNNAAGAVSRLLEMGIDPFLLSGTLLGVIAQRLAKRNCQNCLGEEETDPTIREILGVATDEQFYIGKGCDKCNGSGFSGRIAVYELLRNTDALKELINAGAGSQKIYTQALEDGMLPLTVDAIELARKKVIPLIEAYRVRLE